MFSLFQQDSWYYNYSQAVCLNAKIIHAKFVTEKYNYLFKRENDENKVMFSGMLHIFS